MSELLTLGLTWRRVRDQFRAAGIDTPELDARLLAQKAFGINSMGLVRDERKVATEQGTIDLDRFAQRRLAGEPVSRIIGEQEFWRLQFNLNEATLVPRPETEMLVADAINFLENRRSPKFVDLGTGSGAIAISILDSLPKARGMATDISDAALEMAWSNAEKHHVADRLQVKKGPWWQAVPHTEMFDIIVSNPPYIASDVIPTLQPEVRLFDPKLALDGGWDGLEAMRAIASQAVRRLTPGGKLLLEIGSNQGEIVRRMLGRAGFGQVEIQKDLAGLDRMVVASHS